MSEFFYIPFRFFLQEYKVFGFIIVTLISFFVTTVSSGPFGDLLLFRCFYLNFFVRMVVSGATAR